MTPFDVALLILFWVGVGNVILSRDAAEDDTMDTCLYTYGWSHVLWSWILGVVIWPIYLHYGKQGVSQ